MPFGGGTALAQAPPATVHVTSVRVLNPFQIEVSGTVECVEGDIWFAGASVRQTGPRQTQVFGGNGTQGTCDATGLQEWTVVIDAQEGTFNPGRTLVHADANVCEPDFSACASDSEEQLVHARR
jgi:hypothetical protein